MKKGQMSFFLIIAVFLLFVFIGLYFLLEGKKDTQLTFDSSSIEGYLSGCLSSIGEEGLTLLGKQGGRIYLKEYVSAPHFGISYWAKEDLLIGPSRDAMENELSLYLDQHIFECFGSFEEFEDQGWILSYGDFKSSSSINSKDVTFSATFPLKVSKGEQTLSLESIDTTIPIRLLEMSESAKQASDFFLSQKGKIDLSTLNGKDFNTTLFPYKGALIYRFSDSQSLIGNEPYEFFFALQ